MWWGWFDPVYMLFLAPGMLLAIWAQYRVSSAFAWARQIRASSGYSGAEAASVLLDRAGVPGVRIEPVMGFLSDHYVPGEYVLRLSPEVYEGRSLAALGVAAHESGHAMQEAYRYPLLGVRNLFVPLAGFGSSVAWIIIAIGFALSALNLIAIGCIAFSFTVIFQLVNLPVEFDASRRARRALLDTGLVTVEEDVVVGRVLNAAALTYVAATLTSILTLLYFLLRSGLLGGSRD
jgi:Zn-dependent membrane protease YugP